MEKVIESQAIWESPFDPIPWQIEVLRDKRRFQVMVVHRRGRKTTLALNNLIRWANTPLAIGPKVYWYVAPTYAQAKNIIWRDPNMISKYLPPNTKKNESELYVTFPNTGSILKIVGADKPESLKGAGPYGVVLDEFALMKEAAWTELLRPIITENGGWAWFLYTPNGRNHGFTYYQRAKTLEDWNSRLITVNDTGLISQDDLAKAREEMPLRLYEQEFMCAFHEDVSSVFKGVEHIVMGTPKAPIVGHSYSMGVDLGRVVDFTVITVIDRQTREVVYKERFTQTAWSLQKERIVLAAKNYNNAIIHMDATGFSAGSVIAEELADSAIVTDLKTANLSVVPFNFGNKNKKALVEKLIVSIEQKLFSIPREYEDMIAELKTYTYNMTEHGNIRYTAPEGMFDDCVISLGLAVWGMGSAIFSPLKTPQKEFHIPDMPQNGGFSYKKGRV